MASLRSAVKREAPDASSGNPSLYEGADDVKLFEDEDQGTAFLKVKAGGSIV